MNDMITTLQETYRNIKPLIEERMEELKRGKTEEDIAKEFFFCLLTPQCRARVCWDNIENLYNKGILQKGDRKTIADNFYGIRFRNNKADYIVEARDKFFNGGCSLKKIIDSNKDPIVLREYIVSNVRGMGWKEASHFLRNIGRGEKFAILDRHILKGLYMCAIIKSIPGTLTKARYMDIENSMRDFADNIGIPLAHLDLVFWYCFNKEIFK
ncbi:MAG: N-glycosylase/DNA lyase [Candidatus Ratteibacteria bacterium]|nr:N-glycosylase/DNA lyase [Candidatus Ratteibacteria bacterium]